MITKPSEPNKEAPEDGSTNLAIPSNESLINEDQFLTDADKEYISNCPRNHAGIGGGLFLQLYGDKVYPRFVADWNRWILVKDGKMHEQDTATHSSMKKLMIMLSIYIKETATEIEENGGDTSLVRQLRNLASKAGNMPTVNNHLEALKACDGITIESTDLNKHPDLLGTKSGIVDLETGTLKDKYDPALLITHSTGLPYEPEKAIPYMEEIDAHILEFSNGREDLSNYYQVLYGYGITGRTDEQLMWCVIGPTGSGKSTTDDARIKAMGDYADAITSDLLLKNYSGSKDKFEKETLSGKRTVIAEEPTEGREWSKEEVKSLVGGTSQKVRAPYGQFKTVEIQAKIFLSSNTKPNLSKNDLAIERRLRFIPADHSFHQKGTATNMKALMLTQEYLEGFQLYMIRGAVRYYKEVRNKGIKLLDLEPRCIQDYSKSYYDEEDRFQLFLDREVVKDFDGKVSTTSLYVSYQFWIKDVEGHKYVPSAKAFNKIMRERFGQDVVKKEGDGRTYFMGFKEK